MTEVSQRSELDPAELILVHEPGPELFAGLLWPQESSFEDGFDSSKAVAEHRLFVATMSDFGVEVRTLFEVAATNVKSLRQLAREDLTYKKEKPSRGQLRKIVAKLCAEDLWRTVVERPSLIVEEMGKYEPTLKTRVLSNLYFTRDQVITTDRGIVVGRLAREVRRPEARVVEHVLREMGVEIKYRIKGEKSVLEGGDFIPYGDWALLGVGPRTNPHALKELTTSGGHALGFPKLAAIKDPETDEGKRQQQMHLDTYFAIVSPFWCIVESSRLGDLREGTGIGSPSRVPKVDVYEKQDDETYQKAESDLPFNEFLTHQLGLQPMRVSEADQAMYTCNLLHIRDSHVIGSFSYEEPGPALTHPLDRPAKRDLIRRLALKGVTFNAVDFTNIRKGYGANHCMTQVLRRRGTSSNA